MEELTDKAELLIGSAYGVYIPQMFALMFKAQLTKQEADDLSDPENDYYWEAWDDILNKKFIIQGKKYTLYEDGDLWAIPVEN